MWSTLHEITWSENNKKHKQQYADLKQAIDHMIVRKNVSETKDQEFHVVEAKTYIVDVQ